MEDQPSYPDLARPYFTRQAQLGWRVIFRDDLRPPADRPNRCVGRA
jgi:hypothetical protein